MLSARRQTDSRERQVEPTRTAVTRGDIRAALARALHKLDGEAPKAELVDMLTAQASLETANGAQMFNYNFGGIKGHAPDGGIAKLRTREVLNGQEVTIRDGFRAYGSLDDGAVDYVRTMKTRFGGALVPAARGDVAGFAGALKKAGYYTASETDYARGLAAQMGIAVGAAGASTSVSHIPTSKDFPLTTEGLSRIDAALDADRWIGALGPSSSSSNHRAKRSNDDEDDY